MESHWIIWGNWPDYQAFLIPEPETRQSYLEKMMVIKRGLWTLLLRAAFFLLAAQAVAAQRSDHTMVKLETTLGTIVIELFDSEAPITTKNFIDYVESGFYGGTIFHRVIPNFMVQGGGMTSGMAEKQTQPPIQNEANNGKKNEVGTLAMARTSDPHSATGQFFINVNANNFLDYPGQDGWGYAVFGRVVEGLDVVMEMSKVETGNFGHHGDVPKQEISIQSAQVVVETEN